MNSKRIARRRRRFARTYELLALARFSRGYGPAVSRLLRVWRLCKGHIEWQFLPHYFASPPRWRLWLRSLGGERALPDFCVIGAPKSGTSDLAVSLLLHPNVLAALAKEIWTPDPQRWRIYYPTINEKRRHAKRNQVALSPFMLPALHWNELIYRLSCVRPEMKVVLTLREPAERVYSQWKFEVLLAGRNRVAQVPFALTFESYVNHLLYMYPDYQPFSASGIPSLQGSIYWKAVSYWLERFGARNVMVIDVAEYFRDRDGALGRIQEFVGLPHVPLQRFEDRVNANPLALPPPDASSMARLRAFFRPFNEKLWNVVGERWDWDARTDG